MYRPEGERMLEKIKWRANRIWGRIRFGRWVRIFGPSTIVNRRNVTVGDEVAFNAGVFILGRTGVQLGNRVRPVRKLHADRFRP
jgi:hypothetical protein